MLTTLECNLELFPFSPFGGIGAILLFVYAGGEFKLLLLVVWCKARLVEYKSKRANEAEVVRSPLARIGRLIKENTAAEGMMKLSELTDGDVQPLGKHRQHRVRLRVFRLFQKVQSITRK